MTDREEFIKIITENPEICEPLRVLWHQREVPPDQQDQENQKAE